MMTAVMKKTRWRQTAQSFLVASIVMAAAAPVDAARGKKGHITADDLFIVDCLLPGQIRSLGQNFTFAAPRRPVRTTAQDCAIRGGEFVAYDRANYETALKVWLPQAQGGDAQAQVYVGEIYEQGLGVQPDFAMAHHWYEQAAAQGNSRAQINLGSLYERGLGVERNTTTAMNWYRKASGITDGVLELTTEEEIARRREIERERMELRQQVNELRAELDETRAQLRERQAMIQKSRNEINALRSELEAQQRAGQVPEDVVARLDQLNDLEAENVRLAAQLQQADTRYRELEGLARQRRLEAEQASLELSANELELSRNRLALESAQQEIELLRSRLAGLNERSGDYREVSAQLEAQEAELAAQRARLSQQEAEWTERMSQVQAQLAATQAEQAELAEQARLREQELATLRAAMVSTRQQLTQAREVVSTQSGVAARIAMLEEQVRLQQQEMDEMRAGEAALLGNLGIAQVESGASPVIDIISPQVAVTRGVQSVALFNAVNEYEVVARVAPVSDLTLLRVNDENRLAEVDEHGFFQFKVPIEGAETPVSVEAVAGNGERTEQSFVIVQDVGPSIAEREVSSLMRRRMKNDLGEFHALVIGNNQYAAYPNLASAVNDAKGVAAVLRERYGFKTEVIEDGSRDRIVTALAELTQELDDEDNLLIYYAGHGVMDEASGEGYWLPVDAQVDNENTWISNHAITQFLSEMKAKHVLVVADSCYSGTLSGNSIRPIPDTASDQDLLFISRVRARTVMTSGGLQPVLDQGDGTHSIFGSAFIAALQQNSGLMEGYRLYRSLQSEVQTRSRLARLSQNPEYTALKHAGHEGSEFFFLSDGTTAAVGGLHRL